MKYLQKLFANSMQRSGMEAEMQEDSLTHLYSRNKLDAMLELEYIDVDFCGVLFFNLNNLKKIDESRGRKARDRAICLAVESVRMLQCENVRAYRYSYDKLLVIACNYTKNETRKLVDSWMQNWDVLFGDGEKYGSVSIGIAWDSAPVSVSELIARANTEMYRNEELMKAGVPLPYYIHGEIFCSYGLMSRKQFFDMADYRLQSDPGEYCLVAIDIEHFKLFNKWYGREMGDEFLASFAAELKKYELEYNAVSSYFGGDNFAIFLPTCGEIINSLEKDLSDLAFKSTNTIGFFPGFGVYCVEDKGLRAVEMYDYASEALSHVGGNFENRICYYNKGMIRATEHELRILTEAKEALEKGQYDIYLQPKCRTRSGKVVGAEALVRWHHPTKGFVPPDLFIPILEKNGFIGGIDRYVWELVCKQIRTWLDDGIDPVPISVNISRIDILSMDVVKTIVDLVEKYQIDKKYLEIEITESAYVENNNKVLETVQKLEEAQFTLLMDDFGSGYSSLNMLQQISVDVIKIDMKFLELDKNDAQKGLSILKSVITMTNEINVPIIVEGVETEEQALFLADMGVRFVQGYLFYRPMPVEDFTTLISDKNQVDTRGVYRKEIDTKHMDEVMERIISEQKS